MLAENGGHVVLKDWAHYLLVRMGYVKRKGNTKAKISIENFDELQHCDDGRNSSIPDSELGSHRIKVCPSVIMDHGKVRFKKVPIAGIDDKCQITGVFTVTLDSRFLPPQLIYQGTTFTYLPSITFPSDWHVTSTPNHWANESTTMDYIQRILRP